MDKLIAELNPHEMAIRIAEAVMNVQRPKGLSANEALDQIASTDKDSAEAVKGFYRAALSAAKYLEEAINNYQRVQ